MSTFGPIRERLEFTVSHPTTLVGSMTDQGISHALEILSLGAAYVNFQRVNEDVSLHPGDRWRVHLRPRRFLVEGIDWSQRILKETDDFISVDKPYGIPVHPTCDNLLENVKHQLELFLGRPLWVTHRLDIQTSGVIVFAKSKAYANYLRLQFQERLMEKRYIAKVEKNLECREYVHYINARGLAPYQCDREAKEGWKRCEMVVTQCVQNPATGFYDLSILLKTGRHHQIRSQLSYLETPIIGDELYGSKIPPLSARHPLLVHTRLSKKTSENGANPIIFGTLEA